MAKKPPLPPPSPLRPVPSTPEPKVYAVGSSFAFSEVEKGEIMLLERRLREAKVGVADHTLRIEQLIEARRSLLGQVVERSQEYETTMRRLLKAHSVDLESPDAGSWNINTDDMKATRTA